MYFTCLSQFTNHGKHTTQHTCVMLFVLLWKEPRAKSKEISSCIMRNVGCSVSGLDCVSLRKTVFHKIKYDKATRSGVKQSCILIMTVLIKIKNNVVFCAIM